jgi:hypothetical protein
MNRIKGIALSGALAVSGLAYGGDESSAETAQTPTSNPLSLITMTDFSGPEAEGFHNCFWIGPVSFESYNIAYPDEGAVYWGSSFQLPDNASHLEIEGNYPNARYMSYNAYDKLSQPTDALLDADIVASSGANPFAQADKSGGKYIIKVVASAAPADRAQNTLYLGSAELRNDILPLILRTYVPAEGTDYTGGAGLPSVTLVMKDGSRLADEAMCKALNSPAPGSPERRLPTVVIEGDTYRQLVSGPGTPAGFPASEPAEWVKFWGGDVNISRYLKDQQYFEKAVAGSAAGTWPKRSGFYANIHNDYIGTYVDENFGELLVFTGKLPRTPANGWDITSGDYDLRYWSMCTNESIVTTRYADCVYDSNVALDSDRNYTIVVSKAGNRPTNATAECGVTWLDWGERGDGAGNPKSGHINIRNMLGDNFPSSIQNVSSILSAEKDMGQYFPATTYMSRADFEARGCATPASK